MELSPELDLLERLQGGPMPLEMAVRLFPDGERARHVVGFYVRSGFVRLFRPDGDSEQPVREWELRTLLTPAGDVENALAAAYRLDQLLAGIPTGSCDFNTWMAVATAKTEMLVAIVTAQGYKIAASSSHFG